MAISGQVTLKVTPKNLLVKAQETRKNISRLRTKFSIFESIMDRTGSYWIGEAGELHRKRYQDEKEHIEQMFARLSEHPADLEQIAKTYMDVEDKAVRMASELPSNIIS